MIPFRLIVTYVDLHMFPPVFKLIVGEIVPSIIVLQRIDTSQRLADLRCSLMNIEQP